MNVLYLIVILNILLVLNVSNCECQKMMMIMKKDEKFVSIFPGLFFAVNDDEVKMKLDVEDMSTGRGLSKQDNNDNDKKPNIIQRVVRLLMMIPLVMQVLSLPGALATIKMSLMKSLLMGKFALIIMLYCLIRHLKSSSSEIVVVHKPALPQHYDHHYPAFDDDESWFG